ncbi:cytochrome b5-like heme/steroid binding domain-containing protein [Thiohalophilus sp.]|uniref:cytochrome b5-like heme/steroid binding domain-containing protein n=1 Tax=Thiohalophilus sp. TaxID=3028392 RepID=UPI002ACE688B|nr:cytochrome b5-like heme/steroid binding domain-containing protein [Thiohalophilus sp.]MDZ7663320.1 cytochrome b5-like heme/steroid binding domain-containing protein [Thiohalophilus sp.]
MMRKLFIVSTLLFWIAVAGFWAADVWLPEPMGEGTSATAAGKHYTLAELAGHDQADDCWMAIDGVVYDFSAYLPQHPAAPAVMLAWCGKEASQAFHTKTKGRPHSNYASQLLPQYRLGLLRGE